MHVLLNLSDPSQKNMQNFIGADASLAITATSRPYSNIELPTTNLKKLPRFTEYFI